MSPLYLDQWSLTLIIELIVDLLHFDDADNYPTRSSVCDVHVHLYPARTLMLTLDSMLCLAFVQ